MLTHHDDREAVRRTAHAARRISAAWPALRRHVRLDDDAGPVLAERLWNFTLLVGQRAVARDLLQRLRAASRGVPAGAAADDIAVRIADVSRDVTRLDADITRRANHFQRLASEAQAFVAEQESLAQAAETIRDVDRILGSQGPSPAGGVGDLADQVAAVLDAYRELTGQRHGQPITIRRC